MVFPSCTVPSSTGVCFTRAMFAAHATRSAQDKDPSLIPGRPSPGHHIPDCPDTSRMQNTASPLANTVPLVQSCTILPSHRLLLLASAAWEANIALVVNHAGIVTGSPSGVPLALRVNRAQAFSPASTLTQQQGLRHLHAAVGATTWTLDTTPD